MIGALLDCDGTLVLTEEVWEIAERTAVEDLGAIWQPRLHVEYGGWSTEETARRIAQYAGRPEEHEHAHAVMLRTYDTALRQGKAQVAPGAIQFVRELRANGILVGVVSNSPYAQVHASLAIAELLPHVQAVICPDTTGLAAKPLPDLYNYAVAQLGVDPARSFGVEDSEVGVTALIAARLTAILAPTASPTLQADYRLDQFHPINVAELVQLADRR